ncbi:MAG: hypothetical protein LBQ55_01205 [Treponema sp.]|nr:hypothetical protein [Treponema sp.]
MFPRLIGLLALYCAVFAALVMIQFTKRGNFTHQVGNMTLIGQYQAPEGGGVPADSNEHPINGGASVFFGGLEFVMDGGAENERVILTGASGQKENPSPEYMVISGESAAFRLSGGNELVFSTHFTGGSPELRISASLAEHAVSLELPFKLLRSSRLRESGNGQFVISADGINYTFGRSAEGEERRLLLFRADSAAVSYRAVPEKKSFSPGDFITPGAETAALYDEALIRWRDQNFSLWNRTIASRNDEDMVMAYGGEAVRRGNYKAAVAAVSPAFLNGGQRTFGSSVYLGRMDTALASFTALEREKIGRLSRMINERNLDFLKEPRVFEFLAVRGYQNFIEDGAELVRSIDPATLSLDLSAGILEGLADYRQYRLHGDNPFDRLADQACYLISEYIRRDPRADRVFVFRGGAAEVEFNLRLGRALERWAGDGDWAGIGRSLVLSVLSLTDASGTVPAELVINEEGEIGENGESRISSARLYRTLSPGEYYPHAAGIGAGINGIWAWTAAASVSAVQDGMMLDIAVSFPVGETHYMLIRGIRPFTKIQLYNIDYRTDPQFERYDSSGWVYSAADQILILKMKHRAAVEHIRIFY